MFYYSYPTSLPPWAKASRHAENACKWLNKYLISSSSDPSRSVSSGKIPIAGFSTTPKIDVREPLEIFEIFDARELRDPNDVFLLKRD